MNYDLLGWVDFYAGSSWGGSKGGWWVLVFNISLPRVLLFACWVLWLLVLTFASSTCIGFELGSLWLLLLLFYVWGFCQRVDGIVACPFDGRLILSTYVLVPLWKQRHWDLYVFQIHCNKRLAHMITRFWEYQEFDFSYPLIWLIWDFISILLLHSCVIES